MTMPSAKTEFILIRHGETIWNYEGRLQGQGDSPLTARGVAQAQAVAQRLQQEPFTALYASHLKRVLETARYITARTGHTINIDERLQERAYGIFEGLTLAEASVRYPDHYQAYKSDFSADFTVPNGESQRQVLVRGQAVFQELAQRHPGERLVIVSHGSFLRSIVSAVLGIPLDVKPGFRLPNGSLSHLLFEDDEWRVTTMGEICHLRDLGVS